MVLHTIWLNCLFIYLLNAGHNSQGQLGVAHRNDVKEPEPLTSLRWKAISLGESHAAGVGDGVSIMPQTCTNFIY